MSMEAPKHKKQMISTHHSAAQLPFSLIESEILPRIAAKSDVGRCRCVCKQWKSILSTPTFATMHLHNHATINDYKLLLLDAQPPPRLPLTDPYADVFILASFDGLVCYCLLSRAVPTKLVFWNPLTGVHRTLPSIPSICFYQLDAIGFYKDSSNDYKLVYFVSGGELGVYIYSLRLDSWREIEFPFNSEDEVSCRWSAATSWCQRSLYFTVAEYRRLWIICFDVETEAFKKIGCPDGPILRDTIGYSGSLVILNGCIHLCVSYAISDVNHKWSKQGELWRMDGDDGWVKVAALSDPLPPFEEFTRHHICTTSFGNWVAVLDHENKSLSKVNMGDFTTRYPYFCSPRWEYRSRRVIYVESLVSPVNP